MFVRRGRKTGSGDAALLAFLVAYSVSSFGTFLNLIALALFTLEVTGGPLGLGAVMAVRIGAGFLFGVPAGRLATRYERRRLMVVADLAQAAAMVVLGVAGQAVGLGGLLVAAAVLGAGNTVFSVSLRTSVPSMVGQDRRVRTNGRLVAGRSLGTVLGYAAAPVVVMAGGFEAAFLINAASFLVSAAVLWLLPLNTNSSDREKAVVPTDGPRARVTAGLSSVVLGLVLIRGSDAFGSASHNVALPVHAGAEWPGAPYAFMSWFWTAWAVGTIAVQWVVRRTDHGRVAWLGERAFAAGTVLMSVAFVVAFTGLPIPVLVVVLFVAGLADGLTEVAYLSRLQAAPEAERARLFGLSASAETAGFATGMATCGLLLEVAPPPVVVAAYHALPVLVVGIVLLRLRSRRSGAVGVVPSVAKAAKKGS
ncbi:MFS transporter [Amycolatopsis sp. WAC 01376]|uniref:MFS transporter n=1 Tax=Amycolatopsis sp. WAC 01376 TaxID=2203195 RepID=UPI000F77AB1F|nr:MFS transporter [Amycolatopsis sp. WAC 01376]RSM53562.1 MFS transporter [Amycolatopsis sp. WAC 01376]